MAWMQSPQCVNKFRPRKKNCGYIMRYMAFDLCFTISSGPPRRAWVDVRMTLFLGRIQLPSKGHVKDMDTAGSEIGRSRACRASTTLQLIVRMNELFVEKRSPF